MNIVSLVVFAHVVGVIGLFVTIGFDWIRAGRQSMGAAAEFPRLYRGSLALIVLSGIYLTRGLLQESSATAWELGWLVLSIPALVIVAAAGFSSALRTRVLAVRTALSLALVLLMIAKPPLNVAIGVTALAAILGLASDVLARRRAIPSTTTTAG
jgi:hypothetical protein